METDKILVKGLLSAGVQLSVLRNENISVEHSQKFLNMGVNTQMKQLGQKLLNRLKKT